MVRQSSQGLGVLYQVVENGIAQITITNPPVNSMNQRLWSDLHSCLTRAENDPNIRALIITSGLPLTTGQHIFTAGNDLRELHAPSTTESKFFHFWRCQTMFLAALLRSPLYTVTAINGYCPAGGCILSACCDYIVAEPGVKIGLNEVALGIPVPKNWVRVLAWRVGIHQAYKLVMTAEMPQAEKACQIGLIDQVSPSGQATIYAIDFIKAKCLVYPPAGRIQTKRFSREEMAAEFESYCEEEAANSWKLLNSKNTVDALTNVMEKLSSAKKKVKFQDKPNIAAKL